MPPPSVEVLPIAPHDIILILLHELSCWIVTFDVRPRSCKMQDKGAMFPHFPSLVEAGNLLREGVQLPLFYDMYAGGRLLVVLHELGHGVLLAHLELLILRLVTYCHRIGEELQCSVMGAHNKRTPIEAVAVVGDEMVYVIGVRHVSELFLNYVRDLGVRVGDERVKVQPPQPVVFARFDQALDHIEFPVDDGAFGVRFVVNDEVVAMATGVVFVVLVDMHCDFARLTSAYGLCF